MVLSTFFLWFCPFLEGASDFSSIGATFFPGNFESDEKMILMVQQGSKSIDTSSKSEKRPSEWAEGKIYGGKKTIYWNFGGPFNFSIFLMIFGEVCVWKIRGLFCF